jgi:hypothetical protein
VSLVIRKFGGEVLCARMPAASLVRKKNKLKFNDKQGTVVTAQGITKLTIGAKKDGSGTLTTSGKQVAIGLPDPGQFEITLGLRDPSTAEEGNYCARGAATFRATKKGLKFP